MPTLTIRKQGKPAVTVRTTRRRRIFTNVSKFPVFLFPTRTSTWGWRLEPGDRHGVLLPANFHVL